MDFVLDNIYWIVFAAAGLVQWWRSTQEAKQERENRQPSDEYLPKKVEEFLEELERKQPKPAVPPPLPRSQPTPPRLDRSPVPSLKKVGAPTPNSKLSVTVPHHIQQAQQAELERQAAIAEQIKNLKQAKKNQEAAQTTKSEKSQLAASSSIRDRLKSRTELRQAFIMKEFLEKPVALR